MSMEIRRNRSDAVTENSHGISRTSYICPKGARRKLDGWATNRILNFSFFDVLCVLEQGRAGIIVGRQGIGPAGCDPGRIFHGRLERGMGTISI
jgi:hypothetical protein